jgi:hypothetical protein
MKRIIAHLSLCFKPKTGGLRNYFCHNFLPTKKLNTVDRLYVRGHRRSNGSYVRPHYRSNPDGNFNNNWSTYPNVNPHTGSVGTRRTPSYSAPTHYYQSHRYPSLNYNSRVMSPSTFYSSYGSSLSSSHGSSYGSLGSSLSSSQGSSYGSSLSSSYSSGW